MRADRGDTVIDENAALTAERTAVLETVRSLDPADWDRPSLCAGWRIRDVVGHLALNITLTPVSALKGIVVARGNISRFMDQQSRANGRKSIDALLADLEKVARSTAVAPTTQKFDGAIDAFVHHHDIALVLDRDVPTDPARLRWMADGVPQAARAIGSAQKVEGLRLIATDIDWHYGTGPEVRGPAAALIIASCGRAALDDQLEGPGLATLQARR